jgi:predicted metalloprotease
MRALRTAVALLAVALSLVALPACGGDDADRVVSDIQARAEQARERAREARDRLAKRVREELERLRKAVPKATPATQPPQTAGRTETARVEGYLTEVLRSVDSYWTRTLAASGVPEPRVRYVWVPPDGLVRSGCGVPADDNAAFYCPSDDTIYMAVELASRLWRGIAQEFPGERAGYGHAVGDFGVAYVVAHEYAHNIQAELDLYRLNPQGGAKPFELQADCMAGLWSNSVYREGRLQPEDVEEAMSTAAAAGDFDFQNAQHHGTPQERRDAWALGFESGEPSVCGRYVPA